MLLSEPDRVGEARKLLDDLKNTLAKAEAHLAQPAKAPPTPEPEPAPPPAAADEGIVATITQWKADGFDVAILEKIIATGDQSKIKKNFTVFEQRVERLNKMATVVSKINAPALQEDVDRLKPLLKDVTKYNEAKEIFQGIVDRVKKKA